MGSVVEVPGLLEHGLNRYGSWAEPPEFIVSQLPGPGVPGRDASILRQEGSLCPVPSQLLVVCWRPLVVFGW